MRRLDFQTLGCSASIAASSVTTELVAGKSVGEARALTRHDIAEALDGIPPAKLHSAVLAIDALKAALDGASRQGSGQLTDSRTTSFAKSEPNPGPRIHRRIFHVVTTAAVALMALGLEREVMIMRSPLRSRGLRWHWNWPGGGLRA